jgi:hypothetical protein
MAGGTDLFELLGPPTEEQARRLVALLRLAPEHRASRAAEQDADAA